MLFVNNQLNYDETIRRLKHWTTQPATDLFAVAAIALLLGMLERNRDNLYFETQEERDRGNSRYDGPQA